MYLDLKDKGISSDLVLDGIREPESTRIIQKELKKGDIVVDIGANIGYYALIEARLVGDKGKVYAIEPSPKNFEYLNKNIKLNNVKNIESYKLAIGDKDGVAKMNISPHSNLSSLVTQKNRKIIGSINVNVTKLDNFLKNKKYPNFIRMDVEGYEYNIIKGMEDTFKAKKPFKLFIELHPHIMKKKQTTFVLKTLMESGFRMKKVTRCFTVAEMKVKSRKEFDYSSKTIGDLLKDKSIISGKKGAFEIFFERK
ncbi:MAG: FkbM family methyltransferase [Candidatus Thorarchaeota archaeon]